TSCAIRDAAYLKQQKNEKNVACTDVKSSWPVPTQSGTHPIEAASLKSDFQRTSCAIRDAAYLKQQKNEKNVACTDVKSSWPVPTQSGTHPIEAASLDWGKVIEEKNYKEIPPMDDSEMLDLLQELQNSNCDAVLMRHVEPFASQLSDENNEKVSIPVLFNVYHKKYEKMPLDDLIQLGMKCKMEVTQNIRREIEDKTQDQRKCAEWYRQRTGRVTASIFKDVCRTNVEKPSFSLIKSICYPRKISTRAIRWGINHEQM
uniref:Uncharacterized protein LOC114349228 n=1 Tax=Diabrotica virgifera virgifera TaxID=50390 RepID=A0A6P7H9S3_DIAVI